MCLGIRKMAFRLKGGCVEKPVREGIGDPTEKRIVRKALKAH